MEGEPGEQPPAKHDETKKLRVSVRGKGRKGERRMPWMMEKKKRPKSSWKRWVSERDRRIIWGSLKTAS